jgi:hypothetical protein
MAEVIERIAAYRARVIAIAHGIPGGGDDRAPVRHIAPAPVPQPAPVARPVELDRVRARRLERAGAGGR